MINYPGVFLLLNMPVHPFLKQARFQILEDESPADAANADTGSNYWNTATALEKRTGMALNMIKAELLMLLNQNLSQSCDKSNETSNASAKVRILDYPIAIES